MKSIKVLVDKEEILKFVRKGENCKIEIDYDRDTEIYDAYVLPLEATGFENKINTQTLNAHDYEEEGDEESYLDWLIWCYDEPFEATDGEYEYLIKIEFQ